MPTKVEPEHLFGAGINMKLVVQSSSNVISSRHIAFYLREYILRCYCKEYFAVKKLCFLGLKGRLENYKP
jgi:hypothetical protein